VGDDSSRQAIHSSGDFQMVALVRGLTAFDRVQGLGPIDRVCRVDPVGRLNRLGGVGPLGWLLWVGGRDPLGTFALLDSVGEVVAGRVGTRVLSGPVTVENWPAHHVNTAALREHCMSLTGASETFPFGPVTSVFKVSGKMFALSHPDGVPLTISLKCEPALAEHLREAYAAVLPGYHLNKRHWNTVIIDGSVEDQMIKDMVQDSYDLVVSGLSRPRQHALGWDRDL
jgi:predicted DNA-binding protein (MmcQ/YjbR family)